jgi:hypothetical protein
MLMNKIIFAIFLSVIPLFAAGSKATPAKQTTSSAQQTVPVVSPQVSYDTLAGDLPGLVLAHTKPYLVVSDIYVPQGKTVSIQAGAVFLFKNFTGLQVMGKLSAMGTKEKPIIFTSENDREYNKRTTPDPAPYDWNGIYLTKDAIGTEMSFSAVMYSVSGINSETRFIKLSPGLFLHNGRASLTIEGKEHQVTEEPYEYSLSIRDLEKEGIPINILKDPLAPRRNIVRYSSIAAIAGGVALGIVYGLAYADAVETFNARSAKDPQNLAQHSDADWNAALSAKRRTFAGTLAGAGVFLIGGIGLYISFTF